MKPFRIDIPQARIDAVMDKVRGYAWHEKPSTIEGEDPWAFGTALDELRDVCDYWLEKYDWRTAEAELNDFPQFISRIDGYDIHYIHIRSGARHPEAVILTHGWPGSIVEFLDVIRPLAHPERFGGTAEDGVDVVVPSLIGFGFSGKPPRPVGPRAVAELWDKLMRETLGYGGYIAQGGDFGAMVSTHLGGRHSPAKGGGCRAIHLNMCATYPGMPPETPDDMKWLADYQSLLQQEGAYFHIQYTKPQTLSFAMMESPVGQCAWIMEKFHGWTDRRNADGVELPFRTAIAIERFLTNVMIYLVTDSFNTSTWMYRGYFDDLPLAAFVPVTVPTAMAVFPREFLPWPPRAYVERHYHVTRWTEFNRGGHFAAFETGDLFAEDVRQFAREIKDRTETTHHT
jgi:microsomal epoxide hydrolase